MKIRINAHGGPLPEQHGEWIDLYTAQDVIMQAGQAKLISLGVSMQIPDGYYAHVVPRSSTFMKWGIMMGSSMGVIENDYNGDGDIWGFPAYAYRQTFIPRWTRIAQFRLVKKAEPVEFEQVDNLGNKDRGGFGSTGD